MLPEIRLERTHSCGCPRKSGKCLTGTACHGSLRCGVQAGRAQFSRLLASSSFLSALLGPYLDGILWSRRGLFSAAPCSFRTRFQIPGCLPLGGRSCLGTYGPGSKVFRHPQAQRDGFFLERWCRSYARSWPLWSRCHSRSSVPAAVTSISDSFISLSIAQYWPACQPPYCR